MGKKLAIKNIATKNTKKALFIDFLKIIKLEDEELQELISNIEVEHILKETFICITNVSLEKDESKGKLDEMVKKIFRFCNIVFITSSLEENIPIKNDFSVVKIKYEYPLYKELLELWDELSKDYLIDKDIDFKAICSAHILSPMQIKSSLENAYAICALNNTEKIDSEVLNQAIFLRSTNNLSKLAERLESNYTWEDLVMEDSQKEILLSFCNRIKYGKEVNERWEKNNKLSYGMGTSLLLYGAPGTGKTMSAYVIANELNLELYRINLSQIISKYIGETSKNIDAVFKEAENNNIILFFDEADALFSRRNEVRDSTDKYANADTAHLLQKVENFKGVSILATNLAGNIDEAFKRRINYMVNVRNPGVNERIKLWENIFPKNTQLSVDIDFEMLAEKFEFSGSSIKSIALQADYFAKENDEKIGLSHILKAVKLEYIKQGKVIYNDIFSYYKM